MPSKNQSQGSKIVPANKVDKSMKGKGKENDPPSLPQGGEPDNTPVPPPTPSPAQELTSKVIAHFTSHWDTFKKDCLDDVTSLSELLNDPEKGLVKKVSTLETNYTDLQSRVTVLETDRPQESSVNDSVLERIQSVENKCDPLRADSIPFQVSILEEKMDRIAEINDDGEVLLKHPDVEDIREDLAVVKEDIETIGGFLHTISKEVKSLHHRATMNSAKLMRNTLIFGGVRSTDEEPPLDSLKLFLNNFLRIIPQEEDMWDIEKLGTGYTRWVPAKQCEMWFPAPIKAKCTESFANKVMKNSYLLGGKEDEEFQFKYYVRRNMPEAHRAIKDKYYNDIKKFREDNRNAEEGDPKTSFYFNGENFFVNGALVEEDIHPPTFRDMMSIDPSMQTRMDAFEFASAGPKEIKESSFQGYAVNVSTLDDVELAYMRVRQKKRYADHIMLAYRIQEGESLKQGCAHDKEYYGDMEILKEIKRANAINIAVFVAREYGGIPLGQVRFEIIRELAKIAIENAEPSTVRGDLTDPKRTYSAQRRRPRKPKTNFYNQNHTGNNSGGRGGFHNRRGRGGGSRGGQSRRGGSAGGTRGGGGGGQRPV